MTLSKHAIPLLLAASSACFAQIHPRAAEVIATYPEIWQEQANAGDQWSVGWPFFEMNLRDLPKNQLVLSRPLEVLRSSSLVGTPGRNSKGVYLDGIPNKAQRKAMARGVSGVPWGTLIKWFQGGNVVLTNDEEDVILSAMPAAFGTFPR